MDERIQAHIQANDATVLAAARKKVQSIVEEIDAREDVALEQVYAQFTEKVGDDGKHRCVLCTKLFKTAVFVKKHVRNKHPELTIDKIAKSGEHYMWEAYRDDENRPMPPYETTNHAVFHHRDGYRRGGTTGNGIYIYIYIYISECFRTDRYNVNIGMRVTILKVTFVYIQYTNATCNENSSKACGETQIIVR